MFRFQVDVYMRQLNLPVLKENFSHSAAKIILVSNFPQFLLSATVVIINRVKFHKIKLSTVICAVSSSNQDVIVK